MSLADAINSKLAADLALPAAEYAQQRAQRHTEARAAYGKSRLGPLDQLVAAAHDDPAILAPLTADTQRLVAARAANLANRAAANGATA